MCFLAAAHLLSLAFYLQLETITDFLDKVFREQNLKFDGADRIVAFPVKYFVNFFELLRNETKKYVSPTVPSAPNAPAAILPSIENTYALSNPFPSEPSIVFSPQKPFYSQSNYSSW